MEEITRAFQSLSYLIEVFLVLIAVSGLSIAFKGYKAAGTMIGLGAGLHALGYYLLMHRDLQADTTPLKELGISTMYPGFLLLTVGICYLAYSLHSKRRGA